MRLFRPELTAPPFPLWDVHANLGRSDSSDPSHGRLPPDEYLRLMAAAGIERACAFPPQHQHYRAANEALAAWAAGSGGRVLPFARLGGRAPRPIRASWQLRRWLQALPRPRPDDVALEELGRYAGIKLIPHLSGLPRRALWERIAALRLPVLVHAGTPSPPRWIAEAILPRVRGPLILAHLGAFPCDTRLLRDAVELAAQNPQIYLDTSGAWLAAYLRYAAERVPHKLLFGSDAPMVHPLVAWHHLASVVADEARLARIGYHNAARIWESFIQDPSHQTDNTVNAAKVPESR